MKRILYYDCFAGISGDMNLGALVDLGVDPRFLEQELGKLNIDGFWFYTIIFLVILLIAFLLYSLGELLPKKLIPTDKFEDIASYTAPLMVFLVKLMLV